MIRDYSPVPGSTHRPGVHCRLQGTPADLCAPPTPGAPAGPGSTRALSPRLPTERAAAFCPQSEAWPRGDVASSALARRRFSRSQGTAESLKSRPALALFLSPFLPLRVGAHLPTPSARKLSGHPCGSLSSSSRYSAAPGSGGGGSAGGRFDGVGTWGGFEPPIVATLDRHGLLCFPSKLLEGGAGLSGRDSISVLRTEVGGPRRLH